MYFLLYIIFFFIVKQFDGKNDVPRVWFTICKAALEGLINVRKIIFLNNNVLLRILAFERRKGVICIRSDNTIEKHNVSREKIFERKQY